MRVSSTLHPLFGRLLSAKGFKRRSGVLFLIVILPDGSPGTIPAEVTNIFGETVPELTATVLSVEGIQRLQTLVRGLKNQQRSRSRANTRK